MRKALQLGRGTSWPAADGARCQGTPGQGPPGFPRTYGGELRDASAGMQIPGALRALLGCFNHGEVPRGKGSLCAKVGAKTSVQSEAQQHGERWGTKDAYVRAREVHLLGTKSSHFSSPRWQRKWMEDPSVKGHQSLGSNPPSAYQCYRVY